MYTLILVITLAIPLSEANCKKLGEGFTRRPVEWQQNFQGMMSERSQVWPSDFRKSYKCVEHN